MNTTLYNEKHVQGAMSTQLPTLTQTVFSQAALVHCAFLVLSSLALTLCLVVMAQQACHQALRSPKTGKHTQ